MKQYTIEELSSIFQLTKQSIYNFLKKDPAFLKEHSTRKQRKMYYDAAIFERLRENYGSGEQDPTPQEAHKAEETPAAAAAEPADTSPLLEQIAALQAEIEALRIILEDKNARIAFLEDREKELIHQNGLVLYMLKDEREERARLLPPEPEKKKGLWQRIIGK